MTEKFVRGNDRLNHLLADPQTRDEVTEVREGMEQADRAYRMRLAAIRHAADLTQVELAERMGVKQAAISGLEGRSDLLLSTLSKYLDAAGASGARIVVTMQDGQEVELALPTSALAAINQSE